MKTSLTKNTVSGLGILLMILLVGTGAYFLGKVQTNPIASALQFLSPTPTPDPRHQIGESVPFSNLNLVVEKIWRIEQPKFPTDVGMAIVTFHANKKCHRQTQDCAFHRAQFRLFDHTGREYGQSNPPSNYVPGMKFIHLIAQRQLSGSASETGQVFFQIDKNINDYTLTYTDANGATSEFAFTPPTYSNNDVQRNLVTTPFPTIIHLTPEASVSAAPTDPSTL